jgi:Tol biopolymer transport system component
MPDGREVIYKSSQGVHRQEVDGPRHSEVPGSSLNDFPSAVSPDGQSIAIVRLGGATSADIYILSATGAHEPRAWLATPAYDGGAKWSPDGQWMVYSSLESGQSEVYLQPYPGPGVRRQVSVDGGSHPIWSRDGRELFYRNNSRVLVVDVARVGSDVTLSQPRLLFDRLYGFGLGISIPNYDLSADGREFAFVKDAGATHVNVILDWFGELRAKIQ